MLKEELFEGFSVNCEVIRMGKDYTLAVYGGDTPHAGTVVMTVARPSLTGKGIRVTTSVLTGYIKMILCPAVFRSAGGVSKLYGSMFMWNSRG